MVWTLSQVALGGALGSMARYLIVAAFAAMFGAGFPWGTLLVNVFGSMLMGVFVALFELRGLPQLSPLVLTGFLGGFTTFSAFSLDAIRLWQTGSMMHAGFYIVASVLVSVMALGAALALTRGLLQ